MIGKGLRGKVIPDHRLEGIRRASQAEILRKDAADTGTTWAKSPAWYWWALGSGERCVEWSGLWETRWEVALWTQRFCKGFYATVVSTGGFRIREWLDSHFWHNPSGCEPGTGLGAKHRGQQGDNCSGPGKRWLWRSAPGGNGRGGEKGRDSGYLVHRANGICSGLGTGVRESTTKPRHDSSAPADGAAMSPGSRKTGRRS